MTYVFDIDGTICTNTHGSYKEAKPKKSRIEIVNNLYDEGHTITLYTARGMGRNKNKADLAFLDFYDLTRDQLDQWGVKYHSLFLGKPAGDVYIDDKGINDGTFFGN